MDGMAKRFGQILRQERVSKGLSQEKLAGLAGLDRSYMHRLESGRSSPTLDTLESLARALQVLPSELIARVDGSEEDDAEEDG
jgi:XRE family transcriptional regulator, regulator of sulfur utilization